MRGLQLIKKGGVMKLLLTGQKQLSVQLSDDYGTPPEGEALLGVLCCGVCRTDAKMWAQGHRDLVLPRVPGHEMVVADEQGRRYAVWPGDACGKCRYCRKGREHLCRQIKIIGFHRDGGFADHVIVPKTSLIPLPDTLDTDVACLAEPAGCVMHALDKCGLGKQAHVLIYGAGTMGVLAAMAARVGGAEPMIVEKNPHKMNAARIILADAGIPCVQEANQIDFDVVINACPDPDAFRQGLKILAKGGCFCFFSGLSGGAVTDVDLINLIHYREITIVGSYGLNREDMQRALPFLSKKQAILKALIDTTIKPEEVAAVMGQVLSGSGFRKIINFSKR